MILLIFSCSTHEYVDTTNNIENGSLTRALDKDNLPDHPCDNKLTGKPCSICGKKYEPKNPDDNNYPNPTKPDHICDYKYGDPHCTICMKKNPDYTNHKCHYLTGSKKCDICGKQKPENPNEHRCMYDTETNKCIKCGKTNPNKNDGGTNKDKDNKIPYPGGDPFWPM